MCICVYLSTSVPQYSVPAACAHAGQKNGDTSYGGNNSLLSQVWPYFHLSPLFLPFRTGSPGLSGLSGLSGLGAPCFPAALRCFLCFLEGVPEAVVPAAGLGNGAVVSRGGHRDIPGVSRFLCGRYGAGRKGCGWVDDEDGAVRDGKVWPKRREPGTGYRNNMNRLPQYRVQRKEKITTRFRNILFTHWNKSHSA